MSTGRSLTARTAGLALATKLSLASAAAMAGLAGLAVILLAWLAVVAGAGVGPTCSAAALSPGAVPEHLQPIFSAASERYRLGSRGPATLAALTKIESGFGQNMGPSSAGAIGWTQFLPSTWRRFGVDADGDGTRDPYDPDDAIHSSANYLSASGAPGDWRRALFAYNHSTAYVRDVLALSEQLSVGGSDPGLAGCVAGEPLLDAGVERVAGSGDLVPVPGFPDHLVDERILDDVVHLVKVYPLTITAAYAPTGHKSKGEHPLGLALDLVPGPGGTWDDVDRLARWAEPRQGRPRPPFRWVGYDGDSNHGRGDHLHLSWDHGPASGRPPAAWVMTLRMGDEPAMRRRKS